MSEGEDSVTIWIQQLKSGNADAAEELWRRYFERLVKLAQKRLQGASKRVSDEEDVALSAFNSVCLRAAEGKFPKLDDRDDLWKLLVTITARKASAQRNYQRRQKRGSGEVRGESVFIQPGAESAEVGLPQAPGAEPSPDIAAQMAEDVRLLLELLPDDTLRRIAQWKLEGYTNDEIAGRIGSVSRTVERKLNRIRAIWSSQRISDDLPQDEALQDRGDESDS
jgi:RNA polymerase sigma factor (sigma-70 family)